VLFDAEDHGFQVGARGGLDRRLCGHRMTGRGNAATTTSGTW
jgi:hypothetical protein